VRANTRASPQFRGARYIEDGAASQRCSGRCAGGKAARRRDQDEGVPVRIEGLSAWTDAALLNEAGIPTVCFGPGDIALAHAAEEFVPIEEIERAKSVLARVVHQWCAEA